MATKMASVASVVLKLDFAILRKVFGVERSVIHVYAVLGRIDEKCHSGLDWINELK